ncbi:DUF1439 domain-containing protein [Methylophilus luteus]|uniref:DUF1439 domain-containing protein n=1 Tax=Methylophilus luteus TaxID=640108 RepID=A0ABW3F3P7_9PROT
MRLFKNIFSALLVVILLSQCATMMGERTVRMSASQIQQKLNSKLEKPFTVKKMFHVQLSNALVTLDPATGRIHTSMDANIGSELLANTATGKATLSGLLKFDAARNAVILDQPAIEAIQLDGANSQWNGMLQQLAKEAGSKWLNQLVLYEVKPEELVYGGTHYQPTDLRITADEVLVTLKPQ